MCGILGWIGFDSTDPPNNLDESLSLLENRGPDGVGCWTESGIWLGHTRLSIIDHVGGKQPMLSSCGQAVIAFNGEIYNYEELKRRYNYPYKTNSDTEVLLAGYLTQGIEFVQDLKGMFAFGLYDRRLRKLYLVRDPFGIKPLIYSSDKNSVLFSSELKSILKVRGTVTANRNGLIEFVLRRYIPAPQTAFEGIYRLNRGEIREIDCQNTNQKNW